MMMRGVLSGFLILVGLGTVVARAEDPKKLGSFKDWDAYTYTAPDSKVCFAFSEPKKSEASKKAKRDAIRFIVTNHPGKKVKGQVSTIIGYPFKEGTEVKLLIDDKSFALYPVGDTAWAGDEDDAIVAAMKAGTTLKVSGTSWKGTETTDNYSLSGISAAIDEIDKACSP
jgi:Invasion associated locus B (IalB) protein